MPTPLRLERVRPASPDEWDAIWEKCGWATYFHSREWAEIVSAHQPERYRPEPVLLEFSDGRQALTPLLREQAFRGLVKNRLSSCFRTYGGPISADLLEVDHARLIASHLEGHRDLDWRTNPFDPATAALFPDERHTTDALPLERGYDALARGFSKANRTAARGASDSGVTIRPAVDEADWRAYDEIYRLGWGSRKSQSWTLFREFAARPSDRVRLWLATHKGRTVAGAVCLYSGTIGAYWHGARLLEAQPGTVNFLLERAIRDACERRLAWFDLGPSGNLEGVRKFKRSYGGRVLACPVVTRTSAWASFLEKLWWARKGLVEKIKSVPGGN